MAIKLKHTDTYSTYFITFTCIEWISLFEMSKTYNTVYNWFAVLKDQYNTDIIAYVIMPNHLYVIIHFQNEGFNLNTIVGNGKRFMAYEIINQLEIKKIPVTKSFRKSSHCQGKEERATAQSA